MRKFSVLSAHFFSDLLGLTFLLDPLWLTRPAGPKSSALASGLKVLVRITTLSRLMSWVFRNLPRMISDSPLEYTFAVSNAYYQHPLDLYAERRGTYIYSFVVGILELPDSLFMVRDHPILSGTILHTSKHDFRYLSSAGSSIRPRSRSTCL